MFHSWLSDCILQDSIKKHPNHPHRTYQCSINALWTAKHGWGLCKNKSRTRPFLGLAPTPSPHERLSLGSAPARSAKSHGAQGGVIFTPFTVSCLPPPPLRLGRLPAQQPPRPKCGWNEMRVKLSAYDKLMCCHGLQLQAPVSEERIQSFSCFINMSSATFQWGAVGVMCSLESFQQSQ